MELLREAEALARRRDAEREAEAAARRVRRAGHVSTPAHVSSVPWDEGRRGDGDGREWGGPGGCGGGIARAAGHAWSAVDWGRCIGRQTCSGVCRRCCRWRE